MSKSLNFELGLSIIKAKKEVDKFVQDTNKKMGKLKTEIKVDSREADKAAKKSHDDRIKAVEKERKANDDLQKSISKNREATRKAFADEQRERQKDFDKRQGDLKKNVDAVKKQQDKIADIRIASTARVERGEIAAGGATLAARKKYAIELERILATSNDRSLEDTRQMIRTLEAEYARLNRMAIKDQNLTSPGIGGGLQTRNIGRQVNMMFNLQQAIEDFSYAGMRGASNNIATMAASLGGKAGIAGMAALAAYNIYQLGDAMGWFGEKTENTTDRIKEQISHLRDLREAERQRNQDFRGLSSGEAGNQLKDRTLELEDQRVELRNTQTELGRLLHVEKEIRRVQADYRKSGVTVMGGDAGTVNTDLAIKSAKAFADAEKLLKENRDILGNMDVNDLLGDDGKAVADGLKPSQQEAREDAQKRIKEIRDAQKYIEHLKSLAGLEKDIADNRERITGTSFSGINVDDLPHAKKRMEEFVEYEKERLKVIEDSIEARKLDIDVLNRRGEYEKAKKATEDLVEETKKWAEETVNASKAAKLLIETHSETYKIASDVADEAKRIADESQRAADAAWEQVKAMKAAKVASQRSFESTVFSARNSILDKQAQEEIQKRQSQLGTVEGRQKYDEFWVKYMFGDNKRTQRLIQERAKLIGQFHSQAMQDIQTQVEREREKRANAMLNSRIDVLQDRSKSQTKAGDFQGSLTTLQEIQGLYLSAMGSAGSSAQMQAFLKRAEDVQKQMDAVHDKNIERETEAAEKATERAKQAQELLDQSLKTKEAIESLDPNANGALDKLLQMQNMLEQMRLDAEGIKMSLEGNGVAFNGFGPIPGGNQVAGVGGGNNITNINVASINTNAANAGSLVTDLNAQAKRKGIMVG